MPIETQFGMKTETTWGTAVVVDRFYEFDAVSILPELTTYEGKSLRASTRGLRYDRTQSWVHGWAGSVKLPVLSKGFGLWMVHMLGINTTTGPTDSAYFHKATAGTLCNDGFTAQVNMPLGACGDTAQAITWEGGKVAKWTLSQEQGGVLMFEADLLFEAGTTGTALAAASYPTSTEFLPWVSSSLTIGGTAVPVASWSVSCDNKLDDSRFKIRSSAQRQEPIQLDWPDITFECVADFEALATAFNRVTATTAATQQAAVVITVNSPTLIGATAYAGIDITMSAVRFDEYGATVDGPGIVQQNIKGKALVPSSGSFCEVSYRTTDTTA